MRIGIVSDTHGYIDERLIAAFAGVDAVLHAGDVGGEAVLEALRTLAPVYAVHGNNDAPLGGLWLPEHLDITLDGVAFHLVHELRHAKPSTSTDVIVTGHSHRPVIETRAGVLYVNPGAAGRVGFHALQTAALAVVEAGMIVSIEVLELGPRLALPRATKRRPTTGA